MSRVEIDLAVQAIDTVTGRLNAAQNKSVNVYNRNADGTSGSAAPVYTTPLGGTTYTQPLTTDSAGRIDGWVEQGSYNLTVSGTGITTYTQAWDAMPAASVFSTFKNTVRGVATTNVSTTSPGTTIGGVTAASGDRFLLTGQTTGSQNGIWTFNGSSSAMTRPTDYSSSVATTAVAGSLVVVTEGTTPDSLWICTTDSPITIDTTATSWTKITSPTKTFQTTQSYVVQGAVALPSGETNYLPPFFVAPTGGQTTTLVGVYAVLHSGTGTTTVRIDKNGTTTGTSINVPTTTASLTSMSVSCSAGDYFAPVVTAVGTSPQNMSLSFVFSHTV